MILGSEADNMMLRALVFAGLLAVAFSLKQSSCSISGTRKAKIHKVLLNPDPIRLSRGQFTLGVHAQLYKPVSGRVEVDFTIKKKMGFLWTRVPCATIGGCTRDLCAELKKHDVKDVSCPFQPQVVKVENIKIDIPELSGAIEYLLTGKLWAEVKITENGREIACEEIELEIKA